jgi:hypothetical protein
MHRLLLQVCGRPARFVIIKLVACTSNLEDFHGRALPQLFPPIAHSVHQPNLGSLGSCDNVGVGEIVVDIVACTVV